jgi:hypothetical protein
LALEPGSLNQPRILILTQGYDVNVRSARKCVNRFIWLIGRKIGCPAAKPTAMSVSSPVLVWEIVAHLAS